MEECARMNCNQPAVALLTFSPTEAKAWLYDLEKPDPSGGIQLCRKHANATVVPMSWQLVDARDPAWPGPVGAQPALQAMAAATAEELLPTEALETAKELLATSPEATEVLDTVEARDAIDTADLLGADDDLMIDAPERAEELVLAATAPGAGQVDASMAPEPVAAMTDAAMVDLGAVSTPDPSLFELPITDIPAVTPYPY